MMYDYMKNIKGSYVSRREHMLKNGWPDTGSKGIVNMYRITDTVLVHYDHNIIYALSYLFVFDDGYVKLYSFEVNPEHIRKGYGTKAFKDVCLEALKMGRGLILSSLDKSSDSFYRAMGMIQNERVFTADKVLLKSIIRGEK